MRTAEAKAVSASEAKALFSDLQAFPAIMLAVSGGPDSTALMFLAARWRDALKVKPKLFAVTIDHRLRKESRREAIAVARLARKLRIAHRTMRWRGHKPAAGLQEAARAARYRLLGEAARKARAARVVTAHTLDDQAETVLIRMSRGSGITGLGAMAKVSPLPNAKHGEKYSAEILLVRPLLNIPKARLIATLRAAKIPYADDPSNRDPKFTRARLRALMGTLAVEGLDARRLGQLARRLRRAETAINAGVDDAEAELMSPSSGSIAIGRRRFMELPDEIALRLLARALTRVGDEGPVELGKLEALKSALDDAQNAGEWRFRRTLAGAAVTLTDRQLIVERAPPRRRRKLLTKRGGARAIGLKTR